jgi:Glycosyl hydrolase catalytic core
VSLPSACGDISTLGLSWYYDWSTDPMCADVGVPFVPMVWGDWCADDTDCSALPASLADSGSQYLLAFNEPDNPEQSNLTVERALQLWPYLEATGMKLGSPAVTDTSQGSAWLAAFMTGAKHQGLRVHFLAVHWYGDCSDPSNLITYLAQMATYGLPLWLTEFSCYKQSTAVNAQFLQEVAPMLAALPYLERVAWFTNRPYPKGYEYTSLLNADGSPTSVGEAYQAIPAAVEADGSRVSWPGS